MCTASWQVRVTRLTARCRAHSNLVLTRTRTGIAAARSPCCAGLRVEKVSPGACWGLLPAPDRGGGTTLGLSNVRAGLLAPFAAGSAVILPAEGRFAAGTFWRDAVQHKATFYTAVPTMHQILLSRAGEPGVSNP